MVRLEPANFTRKFTGECYDKCKVCSAQAILVSRYLQLSVISHFYETLIEPRRIDRYDAGSQPRKMIVGSQYCLMSKHTLRLKRSARDPSLLKPMVNPTVPICKSSEL